MLYGNSSSGFYEKHNYSYPGGKKGYLLVEYTRN